MTEASQGSSHWSPYWRAAVFLLATMSLSCLIADFYGICAMRVFAATIFLPSTFIVGAMAVFDCRRGDGKLARAVMLGAASGLAAAGAYDIFRLPFVFAREWGISSVLPALSLFKVFPAFGALLLGQPVQQASYSRGASMLGWMYHFSNGVGIGVMYLALIGNASRRHWAWAVLLAIGLELGMLLTPYARVFGIPLTSRFIFVT